MPENQKYLCMLMGCFYGLVQKGAVYLLTQQEVPCKLSQLICLAQRGHAWLEAARCVLPA